MKRKVIVMGLISSILSFIGCSSSSSSESAVGYFLGISSDLQADYTKNLLSDSGRYDIVESIISAHGKEGARFIVLKKNNCFELGGASECYWSKYNNLSIPELIGQIFEPIASKLPNFIKLCKEE